MDNAIECDTKSNNNQNINDNITHIISLLDPNVTTQTPSPEIGEEMSQKNDAITISPQTNYGLGMHSKNISRCQTKEPDDDSFENFSDDSNSPHQHHQLNKPFNL